LAGVYAASLTYTAWLAGTSIVSLPARRATWRT
jgi:hypothetical protein